MAVLQTTKTAKRESYTIEYRILKYLREENLGLFTSNDIAKALNLSSRTIGGYLKWMPGVRSVGKVSGWYGGNFVWEFKEPGWQ